MTEKQAMEKGYGFTGSYTRQKDEIQERAKEYKNKGYKVAICTVPDSKLSRGLRSCGYSIYAEPKYFIDQEIEKLNKHLSEIEDRKTDALKRYQEEIAKIDSEAQEMQNRLMELNRTN